MKIQVGEVVLDSVTRQPLTYKNKSVKYLLPALKEYGEEFTTKANGIFKLAIGIGDIILSNLGVVHEKHVFVLCNTSIAHSHFVDFINWIKDKHMYVDDYVFGNIQHSTLHMIVLKFPEKYYDSFDIFKTGAYSKMYPKDAIDKFFNNHPDLERVLIKDHNYKVRFVNQKLNRLFNTDIKPEEWDGELDLPPQDKTEIFNHHLKKK